MKKIQLEKEMPFHPSMDPELKGEEYECGKKGFARQFGEILYSGGLLNIEPIINTTMPDKIFLNGSIYVANEDEANLRDSMISKLQDAKRFIDWVIEYEEYADWKFTGETMSAEIESLLNKAGDIINSKTVEP